MPPLPAFMTASSEPALIGALDRLMGGPGSAKGPVPRLRRGHGPGGRPRRRRALGRPVSRPTAPAVPGPVPAGPGSAARLTGAQGMVREPSLGGPRLLDDGLPSGGRCRLLGVFAHPDDETFCAGGTFARYAEQGAEIMVVSATRGQAGQIRDATAGTRRSYRRCPGGRAAPGLRASGRHEGALPEPRRRHPGRRRVPGPGGRGGRGHPRVPAGRCHHFRFRRRLRPSRPRHHQRSDDGRLPAGRRPQAPPGPDGRPAPPPLLPVLPAGRPADDGAAGDLADQSAGPLCRDARLCPRSAAAGRGGRHDAAHPRPRPGPLVPAGFVRRGAGRGDRRAVLDLVG